MATDRRETAASDDLDERRQIRIRPDGLGWLFLSTVVSLGPSTRPGGLSAPRLCPALALAVRFGDAGQGPSSLQIRVLNCDQELSRWIRATGDASWPVAAPVALTSAPAKQLTARLLAVNFEGPGCFVAPTRGGTEPAAPNKMSISGRWLGPAGRPTGWPAPTRAGPKRARASWVAIWGPGGHTRRHTAGLLGCAFVLAGRGVPAPVRLCVRLYARARSNRRPLARARSAWPQSR